MCRSLFLFVPLLFMGGCLSDPQYCRYPDLLHPGHISEQQQWAEKFDPFASPEMGPKIAGDRPSGALDPTHSSQRSQKAFTPIVMGGGTL
ncbi:MAG: hypothetical protein LBI05_01590 [Planctomycetaceae bacterium]|jgi:hypothetical protein|nr:hypothetical protein [Planctomycetaceae bacterium]